MAKEDSRFAFHLEQFYGDWMVFYPKWGLYPGQD